MAARCFMAWCSQRWCLQQCVQVRLIIIVGVALGASLDKRFRGEGAVASFTN
jgi:hypothetical protein